VSSLTSPVEPEVTVGPRLSKREKLSPYKEGLPTRFMRVAQRGRTWNLPRSFKGYKAFSQHEMSIGGAATKCFLAKSPDEPKDAYIAKFAHKNGSIETYTELLNNLLGSRLGFNMAHFGAMRLDGILHFVSKSFRDSAQEKLVHGSLMVEQHGLATDVETEGIKTAHHQQRVYDVDFVRELFRGTCGDNDDAIWERFVEMLVFDALIGSMDRHPRNWGVIVSATLPQTYRFSPIYDSARALLWDYSDDKLETLSRDSELKKYVVKSSPRVGLPLALCGNRKCTHFELIEYLLSKQPDQTSNSLRKINVDVSRIGARLLGEYPFVREFSSQRRRTIVKVLSIRHQALMAIAEKGGVK
jgi:hypothetical protein